MRDISPAEFDLQPGEMQELNRSKESSTHLEAVARLRHNRAACWNITHIGAAFRRSDPVRLADAAGPIAGTGTRSGLRLGG